jgi:hypothetical protein
VIVCVRRLFFLSPAAQFDGIILEWLPLEGQDAAGATGPPLLLASILPLGLTRFYLPT